MPTPTLSSIERATLAAVYLHGSDATLPNGRRPSCATYRALARKGLWGAGGLTVEGRPMGKAAADEDFYRVTRPDGARVEWLDAAMTLRRGVVVGRQGVTLTVEGEGGERREVVAGDTLVC